MIIVADDDYKKSLMWNFLKARGVELAQSSDFQAIARVNEEGKILGVVAYNGFCGKICTMHIAGDGNWVSRDFIRKAFAYPFRQLGLAAIIGPVPELNTKALKFDTHFGFKEVHRIKDGWDKDVDLVILQLRREDCKWLLKLELLDEAHNRLAA